MFGIGPAELGIVFVLCVLFVLSLALLVWALVDLLQNPDLRDTERIIWAIVVIFVGCIGPVLYLTIGRNMPPPGSRRDF